jgi:hypothetical protein
MSKKRANVEHVELMGQGRSTRLSALSQKRQNEASRHATSDARERIPCLRLAINTFIRARSPEGDEFVTEPFLFSANCDREE